MSKQNLIILNIGIISLLILLTSKVLDFFNPYMDLESSLFLFLPIAIIIGIYFVVIKVVKLRSK